MTGYPTLNSTSLKELDIKIQKEKETINKIWLSYFLTVNSDEPTNTTDNNPGEPQDRFDDIPNDFIKESIAESDYGKNIQKKQEIQSLDSTGQNNKNIDAVKSTEDPSNAKYIEHSLNIGAYIIENFNIYNKTFWGGKNIFDKCYSWATGIAEKEDIQHQQTPADNTSLQYIMTGAYMLSSLYSAKSFIENIEGDKSFSAITKLGFAIPIASAAMYAAKNHLFDANSVSNTILEYISSPMTHLGFNMLLNTSFLPTYKMAAIPFGISVLKSVTSEYMPTVSHGLEILQSGVNTYNIWDNTSPEARLIKGSEMLKTAYSTADIIIPLLHPILPQGNEKLKLVLNERIEHFTKNLNNISKENVLEDSLFSLNKTYSLAKNISITKEKFASEEINLYTSIRKSCDDKFEYNKIDTCIDGQYDKLIYTFNETNQILQESEA